jgi:hypothetical protein
MPTFSVPTFSRSPSRAAPSRSLVFPLPATNLAPNLASSSLIPRQNGFLSSQIEALRAQLKDISSKSSQKIPSPNPNQQSNGGAIALHCQWLANPKGRLHRRRNLLASRHRNLLSSRRRNLLTSHHNLLTSRRMHPALGLQFHICSHHAARQ